jgi:hypothetical protein
VILSCVVNSEHEEWLVREFGISIWDREKLQQEARPFPDLVRDFEEFFGALGEYENLGWDRVTDRPRLGEIRVATRAVSDDDEVELEKLQRARGAELCSELHKIRGGKAGAKAFERLILDVLNYLFGDYLLNPKPQSRLEDGLSILDIVYRVKPGHPFWDTLTRDFRARVLVFECKNYSQAIQPNQIYSTERYIFAAALRPICFLITRKKPHKHAELAAFGAMREGGKLFVFLDDDDLCQMLKVRDTQLRQAKDSQGYMENDPSVILDQKIYDFLSRMPR